MVARTKTEALCKAKEIEVLGDAYLFFYLNGLNLVQERL